MITYTGPSPTETRAHFSEGTGVSIIDGSFVLEGTDAAGTDSNDYILSEEATTTHLDFFTIQLEDTT